LPTAGKCPVNPALKGGVKGYNIKGSYHTGKPHPLGVPSHRTSRVSSNIRHPPSSPMGSETASWLPGVSQHFCELERNLALLSQIDSIGVDIIDRLNIAESDTLGIAVTVVTLDGDLFSLVV
jgi:hypothetical protein